MAGKRLSCGSVLLLLVVFPAAIHGSPCTLVVDQQLEYDLSPLAAKDHWRVQEPVNSGHADKVIYLSLCHPLRGVPSGCAGNDTGVCIGEISSDGATNVTVPNAGRVSPTGPTIPPGQLMVEYLMEGGVACPLTGETYRTFVNFICTHTAEEETGPVLMGSSKCLLLFAWMTQSACPRRLDAVTTTPCSIQFPSSAHDLHLQTLRAVRYYSASDTQPLGKYEVNICGPVVNGSCAGEHVAVCHISDSGKPEVLATTLGMNVRWEEDKTLALAYQASGQGKNVEVKFVCDRGAAETKVNYVKQNDTTVIFGVRTHAVCPPTPSPSCVVEDDTGNVYDLRPLHRTRGNWEVLQSAQDGQETLYHINICGPVNPATPYICPPGLIGACIAGIGGQAAYNVGLLTSEPTINNENGSITILYSGGEPCKGGQHSHSSRINLICNSVEHGPVLVKKTETCEHIFDWLTPAACPRHFTTGSNCQVKDPLYGNVYDLNPLRNIYKDYKVTGEGTEFLINLCGSLVSSCDGQNGTSGVCQISNNQQYNAGVYTTQMTFNDGTLIMKYTNGTSNCQGNNTRSSKFIFLCDHEVSGRDGPMYFNQNGCSNNFIWKTKYACPPFHVVDCTLYTADGKMYNLQKLSSSDTNLEYYTRDGKKFILNVCRSVVHQKGSRCAYRAGACITDRTHHNSSVNIGEVQSGPYLEDERLMLRYTGGDLCEGHTQLYQTLIEFKCDKDETYPIPQFIGEENCTYYFEVKSAAACPTSDENNTLPPVGRNCTVTSPSGYIFDLSPLKQETDYIIKGIKNTTLSLNICSALKNSECHGEGVGVCSNYVNAGQANDNLYYFPDHLSLHYTWGEQCFDNVNRSTIITFVCGAENVKEDPVLVYDDDERCVYFITWYTELACEKRLACFVDTWTHRIDLSPLIKSAGNYKTVNSKNPKEKFYLNVCRPLNPIVGLNCRPGSAVCFSDSVQGKNPLSLGHPNVTPVSDGSGAIIMYTHGAQCPTERDYNLSSRINFICDPTAGKGNPVFKEKTHDCQYQFEWRTSVACNMLLEEEDSGPQCQIRYDEAKANIDLKPLYHPKGYSVKFGDKNFTVNVCGSACNTSGSCSSDGDSYGLSNKSNLQWHYGQLILEYFGGSSCNQSVSGHKTTTISFDCDMREGFGFPVADEMMESLDCHAVFNWRTNVTCIEGIYATEDATSNTLSNSTVRQNGSSLSVNSLRDKTTVNHTTVSTVIGVVLVVSGAVVMVAIVLIKSRQGNRIVASTRHFFGIHGYKRSESQVENSTLLGTTSSIRVFRADDSDDDLLRV